MFTCLSKSNKIAAFTALVIAMFSYYDVKTLRDLETRLTAKNKTAGLTAEIDALQKRVEELESKSINV
ncbi:hypothetical protein NTE_03438 [Candidatus Nitrososphaera evergladensis SR1]|uniref:Uncharacterized protein n=1 Tax=Candidatus Nitrososphaera evergladensis SR1 TaxID=1459636 RepID=A0A075MUX9_9ARCH|nr:hypothetical protein NTE_03438 [Candidatus Nitrososphaera evergladensis SR1]